MPIRATWDEIKTVSARTYFQVMGLKKPMGTHPVPMTYQEMEAKQMAFFLLLETKLINMGWTWEEYEDICEAEMTPGINPQPD